ncbi:OmpA family protein [Micromonospora sp. NPDC048835]|uniref:OmpA family protein n=1 Tax=Micromonospora sp. NPDC048835 TaxID=3155147 RepID=UPI0033F6D26C
MAIALALLLVGDPAVAWSAPTSLDTVLPAPARAVEDQVSSPILDIQAPIEDVYLRTEDLDGNTREAESGGRIELTLAADVLFAFGKDDLSPAARARLTEIARRLRDRATGTVQIFGHTDSVGGDAANLALSRRRAEAVRDALAPLLVDSHLSYQVEGFGETRPVAANTVAGKDNPKGRASNRRVEIRFDT